MISHEKLQGILDAAVQKPSGLPGVVMAAVDANGRELFSGASGIRTLGAQEKMTTDSVFAVCSLTKAVTGIAIMQLVERGRVSLDDPVDIAKHLPEVAQAKIVSGRPGAYMYKAPSTKITLRMLLTHSAGFSYSFLNEDVRDLVGDEDEFQGLDGFLERAPLIVEPGTTFSYGINIEWVGVLIERISGLKLGDYLQQHIFEPLGLKDTAFEVKEHMRPRLVSLHSRSPDGQLQTIRHIPPAYRLVNQFHSGGGGLFSTAKDYLAILTVFINGGLGADAKTRILEPDTVAEMLKDSVPHLEQELDLPFRSVRKDMMIDLPGLLPGSRKGWGVTFCIGKDELPTGRSAGSIFWFGVAKCVSPINLSVLQPSPLAFYASVYSGSVI